MCVCIHIYIYIYIYIYVFSFYMWDHKGVLVPSSIVAGAGQAQAGLSQNN